MSTVLRTNSRRRGDSALRRSFLQCLPQIMAVAGYAFRRHRFDEREERIAEAVAWTWVLFVRVQRRGKNPKEFPTAVARFAVKYVRKGRLFGQSRNSKDLYTALSASENRRGGLVSLDEVDPHTCTPWKEILVESRAFSPADTAAARIDLNAWLDSLSRRDRRLAERLATGERTGRIARAFRLSPARISQLRNEFRRSWERFQNGGEVVRNGTPRVRMTAT
jgi:hypothetical protein